MENASKALVMAAGILVAIIIIGAFTVTMQSVRVFQKTNLTAEEEAEITAYNEQYTKYLNQYMYGTEIMTMINKYNDTYNAERNYKLTISIKFKKDFVYNKVKSRAGVVEEKEEVTIPAGNKLELAATNTFFGVTSSSIESFRNRAFKCTGMEYDARTGRVNKMMFEEIDWE